MRSSCCLSSASSSLCVAIFTSACHHRGAPLKVAVRVVTDFTEYLHNYLPHTIQRAAEIIGLTEDGRWADGDRWHSLVSFTAGASPAAAVQASTGTPCGSASRGCVCHN